MWASRRKLSTCLRPLLLEISCVDISGGFLVEWSVDVRGCWKLERLRSSAYEAFRVSCMRSIEGDLASVRKFPRVPVMNICGLVRIENSSFLGSGETAASRFRGDLRVRERRTGGHCVILFTPSVIKSGRWPQLTLTQRVAQSAEYPEAVRSFMRIGNLSNNGKIF